jgi:FAD/FMN-containing dehydrogenase
MSAQSATSLKRKSVAVARIENYLSWGRYPKTAHAQVYKPAWSDQVPVAMSVESGSLLPYGLGRSYGDSCLNADGALIDCRRLNRILGFDEATGIVRCEGGVSFADIIDVFLPKGWFLPVAPGTKFVTVGGAIANDVHGKNHHCAGTFGHHVHELDLYRSGDGLITCGPNHNPRMFRATVGGLGLTGVIVSADIQLRRVAGPWIDAEHVPFQSLSTFMDLSRESDGCYEYTVAWIDSFAGRTARGVFFRGNHSAETVKQFRSKRGLKVPCDLPSWLLNASTVKAFNAAYYRAHAKRCLALASYESFFYPLDSIRQWNRLYGKSGFLQYQCVIPNNGAAAIEELLDRIARSGMGSFLAVLKKFGDAPPAGMLSFPRPGLTLALDFAMRGERTLQLLRSLDEVVLQSGGALYPAKDARMAPAMFEASFPDWRSFIPYIDPKMSSSFWRRVTESEPS